MASTTITFGMVGFPVRLYGASKDKSIRFHTVHKECGSRTNAPTVCRTCDREVERSETVKGYAVDKDTLILLEPEELENLPMSSVKTFEVTATVPAAEIPEAMFEKAYFVGPDDRTKVPHKAFILFRDTLARMGLAAVGHVAITTGKENLAVVRPHGCGLVLSILHWPDEMVQIDDLVTVNEVEPSEQEMILATQLVESLVQPITCLSNEVDHYREALESLIASKQGGEPIQFPVATAVSTDDLMAALQASLKAA